MMLTRSEARRLKDQEMGKKRPSSSRKNARKKRSSSSSVMAENRRRADLVANVRSLLLEFFAEDDEIVDFGMKIAAELPQLGSSSVPPADEITKLILLSYPSLSRVQAVNVACAIAKSKKDNIGVPGGWKRKSSSLHESFQLLSHSYQDKGKHAKLSEVDLTLGQAEVLWGGHRKWDSRLLLQTMEDSMQTLPEGCTVKGYLGSGITSQVYEADRGNGKRCALKVLKRGFEEHSRDVRFLTELQNVDGVPRVLECIGKSMFLIEPLGEEVGKDRVGPDLPLAALVEVLQNAHALNIVNRDIRVENLMVAESLQTGKQRLFIHDWGFAEKMDCKCASFCGSIETASDNVLLQHIKLCKIYLVYTAADDLISLVRCIFLLHNPHAARALYKHGNDAWAALNFWAKKFKGLQLWEAAHEAAAQMKYDDLKKVLQDIEHMSQKVLQDIEHMSQSIGK